MSIAPSAWLPIRGLDMDRAIPVATRNVSKKRNSAHKAQLDYDSERPRLDYGAIRL